VRLEELAIDLAEVGHTVARSRRVKGVALPVGREVGVSVGEDDGHDAEGAPDSDDAEARAAGDGADDGARATTPRPAPEAAVPSRNRTTTIELYVRKPNQRTEGTVRTRSTSPSRGLRSASRRRWPSPSVVSPFPPADSS
jgi:hypothetical protein